MAPSPEDWMRKRIEQGKESLKKQEENKELYAEQKRQREQAAAQGATGMNAGVFFSGAGAALGGGFWTIGQVLKYSLLGWTLDANGVPRKDAAALKAFDDTYKATKERGIIGGLASGMGIAA
ncbi:MAG: hypothetical protein Greene071436_18 [Parcubacteria group bacterium Greene0714_36]|nr:MAG: hypothetical protein Greene071436_18 [Parcubacteria group bacterium Greene0714_36]